MLSNDKPTVTRLTRKELRLHDPDYIKLCANDFVRHEWKVTEYANEDPKDFFPQAKEVTKPFGRGEIDMETGDIFTTLYEPPAKFVAPNFQGRTFEHVVKQFRQGRQWERVIFYYLTRAGVVAELLPGVLDGDTTKKDVDILVRDPKPDENGDYYWYGVEVKCHNSAPMDYEESVDEQGRQTFQWTTKRPKSYAKPFTDDPNTWPETVIVDNVKSWDDKVKKAKQREAPLVGVLKIDTSTDSIIFIPTATSKNWTSHQQHNRKTKQCTPVYDANTECFRSFKAFVERLGGTYA